MNAISLTITDWNAWMPGLDTEDQWRQWAEGSLLPTGNYELPKASAIAPMLRRRLSRLGKVALAAAAPLADRFPGMPSIFCSRHGEMDRTAQLLSDLAENTPLSPTHFSLSVHNAIGGVLSIAKKDTSSMTALACHQDDVSTALLEAAAIGQEQQANQVLCVIYDEPLPEPYPQGVYEPLFPYAVAFVVSTHEGGAESSTSQSVQLQLMEKQLNAQPANDQPQALQILRFLLSEQQQLSLNAPNHQWLWHKQGAI